MCRNGQYTERGIKEINGYDTDTKQPVSGFAALPPSSFLLSAVLMLVLTPFATAAAAERSTHVFDLPADEILYLESFSTEIELLAEIRDELKRR